MPIGIVSDEEFARELERISGNGVKKPSEIESHTPATIVDIIPPGRKDGDVNVPDSIRKLIADEALLNGRKSALQLAKAFDISPSSVSAYTNGATSTASYHSPTPSIVDHLSKIRTRATKRAGKTLNAALEAITQEKLDYTDAKDLAAIAKNMSGIIKDLIPDSGTANTADPQQPQFVIYAPQFRDERSFEVVTVQE